MKITGEGREMGRALSNYEQGRDKVLMLIENSNQKLDLTGRTATTSGMLTTGNVDLNANGVAIINIKALASANGTWSIDEQGRIVGKVLCVEDVCIDKSVLTNILNASGQQGQVLGASTSTLETSTSTGQGTSTPPENATTTEPTQSGTSTDITAPVLSLIGSSQISIVVGDVYVEQGATAVDDIDGDITSSIVVTGTVDTSLVGSYGINYTVTDVSGNSTTVTRIVDVVESISP